MAVTASAIVNLINAGFTPQQADALVAIARRSTTPRSRAEEAAKLETVGFSTEQARTLAEIFIAENRSCSVTNDPASGKADGHPGNARE